VLQSFLSPIDVVLLKMFTRQKIKFIVIHHAEKPSQNPIKRLIQRLAYSNLQAYFFASKELAQPFIEHKIIGDDKKIHEVMEGSTSFIFDGKKRRKENFIWVGRLDSNKDPICILTAFSNFVKQYSMARLQMIYGTKDLEQEVKQFIDKNNLTQNVILLGELPHAELEKKYNEAQYFILGSHREGSGYALCEAMACGCVPIVTGIPSFRTMTNNGDCGYLFEPGNSRELEDILLNLNPEDWQIKHEKTLQKFKNDLSPEAIGKRVAEICTQLLEK